MEDSHIDYWGIGIIQELEPQKLFNLAIAIDSKKVAITTQDWTFFSLAASANERSPRLHILAGFLSIFYLHLLRSIFNSIFF